MLVIPRVELSSFDARYSLLKRSAPLVTQGKAAQRGEKIVKKEGYQMGKNI